MSPAAAATSTNSTRACRDENVHHVGHAEHRGVEERGAARHAACVVRSPRREVRTGLDQNGATAASP